MTTHDPSKSLQIIRPKTDTLTDGVYKATVTNVRFVHTVAGASLGMDAQFYDADENIQKESLLVKPDWHPNSPFYRLLKLGDCLPELNGALDPEPLVGLTFQFTIAMNTKNGKTYANLTGVDMPLEEA